MLNRLLSNFEVSSPFKILTIKSAILCHFWWSNPIQKLKTRCQSRDNSTKQMPRNSFPHLLSTKVIEKQFQWQTSLCINGVFFDFCKSNLKLNALFTWGGDFIISTKHFADHFVWNSDADNCLMVRVLNRIKSELCWFIPSNRGKTHVK